MENKLKFESTEETLQTFFSGDVSLPAVEHGLIYDRPVVGYSLPQHSHDKPAVGYSWHQHSYDRPAVGYSWLCQTSDQPLIPVLMMQPEISPPRKLIPEQQETCKTAIRALLETAGKHNWDGEGADPVIESTVAVAQGVVEELPGDLGAPEISADPEGSVEFFWYLDNGTMFTISIGQTGDIAISGLCNKEAKLTGMQWDRTGKIDSLLHCGLGWLREMQER